jgi:alpha-glucosidase
MIGGGEYASFLDLKKVDQDLIVRSAQIQALMPMMQFSLAPWRVLDAEHLAAVKQAVSVREGFVPTILELARKSAITGEPIVRPLEYEFPHQGFERVQNEFMLGDSVLVAPMERNGTSREVILPAGKWVDDEGKRWEGGATYTLQVPLERIPYFTLQK